MSVPDTIVALSSGRPPAGIAVIRVSGPKARTVLQTVAGHLPEPRRASLRTIRSPKDGSILDRALVLYFDGPRTATGEDVAELHCHGGRATVDAIVGAIAQIDGVRAAEAGEFTRRALINGRIDLTEAEGLADLLTAETELQRRSAMRRAGGELRHELEKWRARILSLSAQAEVAIDYVDEEDGAEVDLTPALAALSDEMSKLAEGPRVEPLRNGVRVVIAGPPNSGKSSLINRLSKSERAIVTSIAGTTRDVIEVPLSIDGTPYVFVDTAGLHETSDEVERIGVGRAVDEIDAADILIWLGEEAAAPSHERLIKARAMSDRESNLDVSSVKVLRFSNLSGHGLDELMHRISEEADALLPKGDEIALDRRQHDLLADAAQALRAASSLSDPVLVAEELRRARGKIDEITGRAGVDEFLDALFSNFCLGK